jgi:ureidoglycolate dehydrogenase (NAD+)
MSDSKPDSKPDFTPGSAPATVFVAAEALADFVARLFCARGMGRAEARTLADVLVWADLRGVESHGVERLPFYLGLVDKGEMNLAARPQIHDLAPSLFMVDADRSAGPVSMDLAIREAVRRARMQGCATGVVRRTAHTGAIGYYAHWAARQGFAAIVFGSGPPLMAYAGARVPSLSTSPLAMAAPGGPDGVLMLDMASSVASNGRLKQAARKGEAIPLGWALDKTGAPTTDPAAAAVVLPVGGPKGAALGLLFECMSSLLAGAPLLSAMLGPGGKPFHMQSETLIAIDVSKFRALGDYDADVTALVETMRALPRAQEDQPIRMPGERGEALARRRAREGVPLSPRLAAQLRDLAAAAGIAPLVP